MAGAMEPRGAVLGSSLAHRGQLQPHGTRTEPFPSGLGPKEILPLAFEGKWVRMLPVRARMDLKHWRQGGHPSLAGWACECVDRVSWNDVAGRIRVW